MIDRFLTYMRGATQGKTRVVLSWILLVFMPFLSQEKWWWPGLVCLGAGAFLRCWASGVIHKDNQLSTLGPYAVTRNPLYFGSFLIGTGAALTVQSWFFFVIHTIGFILVYGFIIEFEEKRLAERFGEQFTKYCESTSRFFPLRWSLSNLWKAEFQWTQFRKNKGFEAIFTVAGLLVLIEATSHLPWKIVNLLHIK